MRSPRRCTLPWPPWPVCGFPRRSSRQRCGTSPRPCLPTTWPTSAGGWPAGQRHRFAPGSSWLAGWTVGLAALALAAGGRRPGRSRPRRSAGEKFPGPPAGEVVSLSQLSKSYGPVRALDGIELGIRPGTTVALLGPNGAGKSTAIELLLGLLDADHGSAFLFGSSPGQAIAAGQVGAMLQDTKLMSGVGVGALLRVIRGVYPHPAELPTLIQAAGIDGLLRRRTDQLSVGESQRVRFALAACGDPQLIVLDEPTVAMDVRAREAFWSILHAYAASGKTIVFSTHYLEEADTHAGRIILLRSGRIIADGSPDQVKSDAGITRTVRFRSLAGSPDRFRQLVGVTAVHADGDRNHPPYGRRGRHRLGPV